MINIFPIRLSIRRVVPLLVWLLAVAAAWWLYRNTAGHSEASGVAEVRQFTVSSVETGRLASVAVVLGQRVSRGDVVAALDTDIIEGEIAVAEAELRELEAQVPAEGKSLELSRLETERAFQAGIEEAGIELQAARASHASDRAELAGVREELSRQRDLVERRLAQADRMNDFKMRHAALEEAVAAWPSRIESLQQREQAARQRLQVWRSSHAGASGGNARRQQLRPLELRTIRQHEYLQLLRKRLSNMALRAPADAHVTAVVARQGDVLTPGDPVVVMVEVDPRQVIAYLEEDRGYRLTVGDKALMRPRDGTGEGVEGTVASIAGTVSQVPTRFWPAPNRPRWGREVFIRIEPPHHLDPGEAVDITFEVASTASAAPASVAASNGDLTPLVVSSNISARSRLEPSGIIWTQALQRYLVVSDDTGQEAAADNAPWLFTIDRKGVVDPELLPIQGVEQVNDLEAITSSPDGTIYVIASQSKNRQGRRRPARTIFIRGRLRERTLVAEGHVFFHDLLVKAAQADPSLLAALGLGPNTGDDGPLIEIEGLAWHEGALFIGLKEPLDTRGRALIWRLQDAGRLFDSGSLSARNLTLWNRVLLEVEGRPAGISELLFTGDGALLLAATSSEDGALFRAQLPAGSDLQAETLKVFPGLKPEGLCLAPEGGRLTVVFDCQQETPLWTHLEIPK